MCNNLNKILREYRVQKNKFSCSYCGLGSVLSRLRTPDCGLKFLDLLLEFLLFTLLSSEKDESYDCADQDGQQRNKNSS